MIRGRVVDLFNRRIFPGIVEFAGNRIASIKQNDAVTEQQLILPGFVDAHVHIESSLLAPSEFARMAVVHGTVGTVSDPHEIANVCGMQGIEFMLENAKQVPFTFAFGAPSCVPATRFETAGSEISAKDIRTLLADRRIGYLSEMMNWPGVLFGDAEVQEKISIAKEMGKPIDGHAPGLRGEQARIYASHGISTDHECFTLEEAQDKVALGMKILIREGSAARNFDALHPIIGTHPGQVMFCCDDAHPDMLLQGHINRHVKRAIALGYNKYDVLRAASVNVVEHYSLNIGLLREGDPADCIVVDSLEECTVLQTWIKGNLVAEKGTSLIPRTTVQVVNNFNCSPITAESIAIDPPGQVRVIVAHDGELITTEETHLPTHPDVLKICVVNRYRPSAVAVAYVKGFGLTSGALASSVAHDSHNIVAVGTNDADIADAVQAVIRSSGGLAVAESQNTTVLPLPIAGLMSDADAWQVAELYAELDAKAKAMGATLRAPFMTLSFMALLVIPQLKLSDLGLFDGKAFEFVSLHV